MSQPPDNVTNPECPHCGLPTKHPDRWGQICEGHKNLRKNQRKKEKERQRCLDGTATPSMMYQHRRWLESFAKAKGEPVAG